MAAGRLITFSGSDCSGKSTQIALLADALAANGESVRTAWFRPGYSDELDALRRGLRRLRPGLLPTAAEPEKREQAFSRPGVSGAWLGMAILDATLQYGIKIRHWLSRGETVLCDRYLWDALLDLELRFPEQRALRGAGGTVLQRLAPRPGVAFLLLLSYDELLERSAAKDEPFPDPEHIRRLRWERYEAFAASGDFEVVDASAPIDDVQQAVRSRLNI